MITFSSSANSSREIRLIRLPFVDRFALYIAKYWDGLQLFLIDGRVEIDNNSVERTIRPIALNRKNALFAGHDAGAENWAIIASLIETCKLNAVDPSAYLTRTLTALVNGHKQRQVARLLPWT
jgi:hypothetical protein